MSEIRSELSVITQSSERKDDQLKVTQEYDLTFIASWAEYSAHIEHKYHFDCIKYGKELMEKQLKKNYDLYHYPPKYTPFKANVQVREFSLSLNRVK